MSENHLLYWIFTYLTRNHPDVIDQMRAELKGDKDHPWVARALEERLQAYKEAVQ